MAYITAQEVKAIREELKAEFKGFKFGVRKGAGGHSVDVTIKQGPVDFTDIFHEPGYAQINQHWLERTGVHKSMFEKMFDIIKTAPAKVEGGRAWYNNSDAMVDYFDTAYYMNLSVGSWNTPYVQA